MWAGAPHFARHGDRLVDPTVNKPLKFLHWAGMRIEPEGPYWDIWARYRYLNPVIDLPLTLPRYEPVSRWKRVHQAFTCRIADPLLAVLDQWSLREEAS